MRVLWFSNSGDYVSPKNIRNGYNGGGWISALQQEFVKLDGIKLGICFIADNEPERVAQNGVIYYPVPNHKKTLFQKLYDFSHPIDWNSDKRFWPYYINRFKKIITDFKPDVIEVFGSEVYFQLATIAAKELGIPCVLHLQGLRILYRHILLPPGVSLFSFCFADGILKAYGRYQVIQSWNRDCLREKAILSAVDHVLGRTHWDKYAISILNPKAQYHWGGELLRSCFYSEAIRKMPSKAIIISTISNATYKGFDVVLKIADILKNEMHLDFVWKVYGNVESLFFEQLTSINGKDVNVQLCGVASAEKLKQSLLSSTVYCHPSYIENSPNSLAEAQILGIPVVATNEGGVASMVEQDVSGFLFPATDPYMGAYYLGQMIVDKEKNYSIGGNGREVAMVRHDRDTIVNRLVKVYQDLIKHA